MIESRQEARGEYPVPITSRCSCLEEAPPFRTWIPKGVGKALSGSIPMLQEHLAMASLGGQ